MQIFLRMRPAAILLHGATATNPRFKGYGLLRSVGEPKGAPSIRSATQTGCWGAEASAVHVGAETTDSSVEVVQGDPLSAREISSWWDVCTSGMVSCTGIIVSYQSYFHCSIRLKLEFARDADWRLNGRRERNVGLRWWLRFWVVAMRACKRWWEVFSIEPS